MAASAFLVKLDDGAPRSALFNGANAMVVWADSATMAREVAASYYDGDANAIWTDSSTTATAIVADADSWENFSFNILIADNVTHAVVADVTVNGSSTDDTIDEIAAAMVIALNATAPIAGAAYNAGTQVLTIAETTDSLGDNIVNAKVYRKSDVAKQAIPSLLSTVVDEGAAGDALKVTLVADTINTPKVYFVVKS